MQGGPPALGGRAMGVQEVPDDAVKYFLLRRGERHAKQPQFKWFMLNKADEMAGFSFPEMALFIKLFNQGKPPGDHGQDVGGSFPYLVVVALFMLAVMVNGLRTEGNFFCQREHEMREEAVFTGVNECLPGIPDCFSRGTPGAEICRRWAGRGFCPAETCRRTAFPLRSNRLLRGPRRPEDVLSLIHI